jgi:hypothetical protein
MLRARISADPINRRTGRRGLRQRRGGLRADRLFARICPKPFSFRRPRGMGRLPHCWLHWRVLADLGRPLDAGISPDSLRAAIGQARAQIKPRWRTLAGSRTRTGKPKIEGAANRSRWPCALFRLSKPSLTLRACLDEIRTSHHLLSTPVSKIKYSNFVNKPCWPEIRIRSGGRGSTGDPKNVFAFRFGASCSMTSSI